MKKDIFFYSNFSDLSTEANILINKYNLRNHFLFVSFEKHRNDIPKFITCLPTIYTVNNDIIRDEKVKEYINFLNNKNQKNEISPFSIISNDNLGGDQFSYLDSSGNYDENQTNKLRDDGMQNYTLLDNEQNNIIISDDSSTKQSKFDESLLDDYTNRRNNDDEMIKKALNGTGNQINRI